LSGNGWPLPSTDISIRDEDGKELAFNKQGELWVRGPQVMRGYWNLPEETANVLDTDGWLRTGDIATINEVGSCKIVDRIKDMIIVSGFNVYPNEIENVIACFDKVLEIAAIGVPDESGGEVVKIFVVKKDSTLTKQELMAYCKENLTGYKCPRQIIFVDDLPKTNIGKVLRRELRRL
jgi:long-chain acyl-CoA synthetase